MKIVLHAFLFMFFLVLLFKFGVHILFMNGKGLYIIDFKLLLEKKGFFAYNLDILKIKIQNQIDQILKEFIDVRLLQMKSIQFGQVVELKA